MDEVLKLIGVMFAVVGVPMFLVFTVPALGKALSRRIERRGEPDALAELDDLRERVARLEAVRDRVAELEERVDFAERVIAQQKAAGQLKPPASSEPGV